MIDPEREFNRNYFASHLFAFHDDYEKWEKKLNKNADDPYTITKVSKGLFGKENANLILQQPNPQLFAKDAIYQFNDQFKKTMGFYVKNNIEEFFKRNSGKSLIQILLNPKTILVKGGDEAYEKARDAVEEAKEIGAISQDPEKIKSYVDKKVNGAQRWLKRIYGSFGENGNFHQYLFNIYAGYAQNKALSEFTDSNGEFSKSKIEKVLKQSLELGWAAYNKEEREDGGDAEDIYENTMLPTYWGLAEGIFQAEYEEYEKNGNFFI